MVECPLGSQSPLTIRSWNTYQRWQNAPWIQSMLIGSQIYRNEPTATASRARTCHYLGRQKIIFVLNLNVFLPTQLKLQADKNILMWAVTFHKQCLDLFTICFEDIRQEHREHTSCLKTLFFINWLVRNFIQA